MNRVHTVLGSVLSDFSSGLRRRIGSRSESPIEESLKRRLLDLTPVERTKLGVLKITLQYIRRRIRTGQPLRLYRKVLEKLDAAN